MRGIGEPLLGLFKSLCALYACTRNVLLQSNSNSAAHYGDFDDDRPTLMFTLARILPLEKMPTSSIFLMS